MQTEHHRGIKWQFVFDCIPETEISPQPDRFLCRWPHPHRQSRKTSLTVSLPSVDISPGAPRTPYDIRVFKHCGKVNADITRWKQLRLIVKSIIDFFSLSVMTEHCDSEADVEQAGREEKGRILIQTPDEVVRVLVFISHASHRWNSSLKLAA